MKNIISYLFFYFVLIECISGISGSQANWQQKVDYTIQVKLDPNLNTLDGEVEIKYMNNSPDTLKVLYIHLWPNAYRDKNTAFAKQQLNSGKTDFYFAKEDELGYINGLNFKMGQISLSYSIDSTHVDIAKIILPNKVQPGESITLSTPFHVKIPKEFSRMGHGKSSIGGKDFQITQWFPKIAMYDVNGWHPISYVDIGEFYDNFGDYQVDITVPSHFMVAATGLMVNDADEMKWRKSIRKGDPKIRKGDGKFKTLRFVQDNIHDFAWFASDNFREFTSSVELESGKEVKTYFYGVKEDKESMSTLNQSLRFYSKHIGEYPYDACSVVEGALLAGGGMEYPMITVISYLTDRVIVHEVGHNWFQGIIATDERKSPWMDEGMNSYYENRYFKEHSTKQNLKENKLVSLITEIEENQSYHICKHQQNLVEDQAPGLHSEQYTDLNYGAIVYGKVAFMFEYLEKDLGKDTFDACMKEYFNQWKFKHPLTKDLQTIFEKVSGKDLAWFFEDALFSKKEIIFTDKGPIIQKEGEKRPVQKKNLKLKIIGFDSPSENIYHILPLVGWNEHNKWMAGVSLFNEFIFAEKTSFNISPMYSFEDKNLNGFAAIERRIRTGKGPWYRTDLGVKIQSFDYTVSSDKLHYTRIKPYVSIHLRNSERFNKNRTNIIQFSGYIINSSGDSMERFNINQRIHLTGSYNYNNKSVINNTKLTTLLEYGNDGMNTNEPGKDYVKASITWKQELNYGQKGKKLKFRFFAGRFLYKSDSLIDGIYHFRMSGNSGISDYLMDDLFFFRSPGLKRDFHSRQLTENGGAMRNPINTQITDQWLVAFNIESTLPGKIPVRPYFDVGLGKSNAQSAGGIFDKELLFTGGLALIIAEDVFEVYFPLLASQQILDYYEFANIEFQQRISFKLNLSLANPLKLVKF